jgi:ribosomal protein S18 acetylase RimI-like enzyme
MADPDIRLEALTHLDRPTFAAIRSLLPQLKNSTLEATYSPSFEELAEVVESSGTTLIVARAGEVLVGMLTLVMVRLPSARVAHIEDVVVDERCRGAGVGSQLITAALARATEAGAKQVDLTSRPSRIAANRLYQSLGFQPRETNVYRYTITAG